MPVTKWLPLWLPVPTKVALTVSFITQPTTAGSYCAHFFFKQFFRGQCLWFCQQKKKSHKCGCVLLQLLCMFWYFSTFLSLYRSMLLSMFLDQPWLSLSYFPAPPNFVDWLLIVVCGLSVDWIDQPISTISSIRFITRSRLSRAAFLSLSLCDTHTLSHEK